MTANINVLKNNQVFENQKMYESLHSFLLRIQLLHDSEVLPKGVIAPNGSWTKTPCPNMENLHLFHRYSDHQLLELIDFNEFQFRHYNSLFDSPENYISRLKDTFFPDSGISIRRQTGSRIKYCLNCIKEDIHHLGYGYFKSFWEKSHKCHIHKTPLFELPELGFRKSLAAVREILKGNDVSFSYESSPPVFYSKEPLEEEVFYSIFPIQAASCLKISFFHWLSENAHRFENRTLRWHALDTVGRFKGRLSQFDKSRPTKILSHYYQGFANKEPELLREFYRDFVDFVGLELGPRRQGILREVYSIKREGDCNVCRYETCIIKKNNSIFDASDAVLDFDALCGNSYMLSRISRQG